MVPNPLNYTPGFQTKLIIEDDGGFPFSLATPLTYVTNVDHRGTFTLPVGFKTDYASIPKLLWNILPPVGRYDAAAVLHDSLYQWGTLNATPVTRAQADAILNEAMKVLHVDTLQRWAIYSGVRVGGWVVWNKYRARGKK